MSTDYNKMAKEVDSTILETPVDDATASRPGKIVTAGVKKKKKGLLERFIFAISGTSGFKRIGETITDDILIPACKKIIVDSITNAVNMAVYGDMVNRQSNNHNNRTAYNKVIDNRTGNVVQRPKSLSSRCIVDDLYFVKQSDALNVLEELDKYIGEYGFVRVSDLYEMTGQPIKYTDYNFGWSSVLNESQITETRDGYKLTLPRPEPFE